MKATRSIKYQEMMAAILKQNQEDYKRIREKRQNIPDEKPH